MSAETAASEKQQKEVVEFLESFVFMRLGQAISKGHWEAAMMTLRRMERETKRLGVHSFDQSLVGLRQAVLNKNIQQGKQIMAVVTARRVRMREDLKKTSSLLSQDPNEQ